MKQSLRNIRGMSKKIKAMSDEIMDLYSECHDDALRDAGFTLYKASIHLDAFVKETEKKIDKEFKKEIDDSFDDKPEKTEKFGEEFTEGLEE